METVKRQAKKSFLILLLIMLISGICTTAEAAVYAGGSGPNVVYRYLGGTSWETVSPEFGGAVLCLCDYEGHLYAGTGKRSGAIGQVWRYDGDSNWTMVGNNLDGQACSLIVFRGKLYAGTAYGTGRLYRYDGDLNWTRVVNLTSWTGFRCMYVWNDLLYIGDIEADKVGHYDGNSFTQDVDFDSSCLWDFELYDSNLYSSAFGGRVHRSSDGHTWTTIRDFQDYDSWELETFQGYLYVTTGPKLERYVDGNNFSLVWTEPNGYEIISMISTGDTLIFGTGGEAGYYGASGIGRVYTYDGSTIHLISGNMGSGIQSLYAQEFVLTKVDDVNDGDCVGPGREITYTIDYNYSAGPYLPDLNNVNIIDYLPGVVEFISASGPNCVQPDSNTVVWNIGILHPGDKGFVTLKVKVKCARAGGTIRNKCEIKKGGWTLKSAYEDTPVCCCPTLTKVDDVPDGNCVVPDANITYSICYAAHGYGDTNVVIDDNLPDEVNYVSSDPCGDYNPGSHTVTWRNINFPPNASGCVKLVVKVNHNVTPGGKITNHCELKGYCLDLSATKNTLVCVWCPIYVDADANGWNNGYLWENAFTNLQDALEAARNYGCNEIRVAEGTYKPDQNSVEPNGTGERTATFKLINGVGIYGGFPAGGGTWEDRKPTVYETILSGDLEGNDRQDVDPYDLIGDPCRVDNSYHVVTGSDTNETAVLDGFTITGGNANGSSDSQKSGGGMYNYGGWPTYSSPTVRNCTFVGNSADSGGGGMYNYYFSSPTVTNCTFSGNTAGGSGGGIYNYSGSPTVVNCTFIGNRAWYGGGMCGSSGTVTNCILWGNKGGQISGYATVTYSDIEGGWAGVGNINEDPMLESDGYHLTLCSPCIDAGTNIPPGGLPPKDIDGEGRIMNGRCVGEDVVDMGVDEYYLADCNILEFAHCPRPDCRETDVPRDVVLGWRPGIDANTHDVYFGTDKIKVTDANRSNPLGVLVSYDQNDNTYDPCGLLDLDRTYYWRVDEVNKAGLDPCFWPGDVWKFTTANYAVVENFNSYADSDALKVVWKQGSPVATVYLNTDPNYVRDGNSMQYHYDTYYSFYSEAYANTAALPSKIGSNWKAVGVKALSLWFYGQAGNDANEQMYVKLTDGNTPANTAKVIYDGDMNNIRDANWQEWNIALTEFAGVNLANVSRITIGFGDGIAGPGEGLGTVYFDDIRLYVRRCVLSKRSEDFTKVDYAPSGDPAGDCVINLREFGMMADDWLMTPPADPNVDLYVDGTIDFRDIAVLAEMWLEEQLWP